MDCSLLLVSETPGGVTRRNAMDCLSRFSPLASPGVGKSGTGGYGQSGGAGEYTNQSGVQINNGIPVIPGVFLLYGHTGRESTEL